MVDNHGVGCSFGRGREELERGRDPGHDRADIEGSFDLEAVGAVVARSVGIKQLVELGHQLQEIHAPIVSQL